MTIRYFLLFFFTYSQIFSQKNDSDKGFIKNRDYFEEVNCELVKEKIVVPVTINGKIYRFLLDTGAPNIISKRLFDELNLVESNTTNIKDANNLVQSMHATQIPSLKIGSLNFENQLALIYDIHSNKLFSCYNIDGFIGSNLFKKSTLKISIGQQKIYITDNVKNLKPKTKPSKIELVGNQKSPYIKFNFVGKNNNKSIDMVLIDTGMDGYYDMSNRAFNYFIESGVFEVIGQSKGVSGIGIFGAGTPTLQRLLKVETALLNNTSFKNLLIETMNDTNSRIGLEFLNHGDLIIDFKNKNAYFEASDTIVLDNNIPQFTPTIIENKFVVGMVWNDDLAKIMSTGDEIISMGAHKVNEMTPCEIMDLRTLFKNKTNYIIEIKNKEDKIIAIKIQN